MSGKEQFGTWNSSGVDYLGFKQDLMKYVIILILCLVSHLSFSQIINPGFEEWLWIHGGQPYEDLVGWTTNNTNQPKGFASTPVQKGINATGFHAIISSTSSGIDATGPGKMCQTIVAHNLKRIQFFSKCDSLFQTGRCIFEILGDNNTVLYTDSISGEETAFHLTTLDILDEWVEDNDSLTLQFIAAGGFDMWDEMEDGYAKFMVDDVAAEYLSSAADVKNALSIIVFPNPSNGPIHITSNPVLENGLLEIISMTGQQLISTSYTPFLDLSPLSTGVYILRIRTKAFKSDHVLVIRH